MTITFILVIDNDPTRSNPSHIKWKLIFLFNSLLFVLQFSYGSIFTWNSGLFEEPVSFGFIHRHCCTNIIKGTDMWIVKVSWCMLQCMLLTCALRRSIVLQFFWHVDTRPISPFLFFFNSTFYLCIMIVIFTWCIWYINWSCWQSYITLSVLTF